MTPETSPALALAVTAAVLAERQACATICEKEASVTRSRLGGVPDLSADRAALAIRARQ